MAATPSASSPTRTTKTSARSSTACPTARASSSGSGTSSKAPWPSASMIASRPSRPASLLRAARTRPASTCKRAHRRVQPDRAVERGRRRPHGQRRARRTPSKLVVGGRSTMSAFYKAFVRRGLPPVGGPCGPSSRSRQALLALVEEEEEGRTPPYGKALDLGCGSATWGVRLASRGWSVTGVYNVARALRRARDRVRDAGVEMRLVQGDVTRLRESGVGVGYDLVLDTGTFHGLTPAQRLEMGREVVRGHRAGIHCDP